LGYRYILGREPESEEVIELHQKSYDYVTKFREALLTSPEFVSTQNAPASSVYLGYRAEDLAIFDQFAGTAPQPAPGFVTDFHGSRARISSLWDGIEHLDGVVLSKPVPGDYHAETAEWLGVLKAVLAADGRFAAMELGAGMGPWLVASVRLPGYAASAIFGSWEWRQTRVDLPQCNRTFSTTVSIQISTCYSAAGFRYFLARPNGPDLPMLVMSPEEGQFADHKLVTRNWTSETSTISKA
jgi:hypothetical protein